MSIIKNVQTEYSNLKEKNKFNKYSISVKFHSNNVKEMLQLDLLVKEHKEKTGKDLYVKTKGSYKTIEISNLFNNFNFIMDGVKKDPIHIPFDSLVNVEFSFITTKNGTTFPCLKSVELLKLNEENIDSERVFKSDDNGKYLDANIIEVSRIGFIPELNQYKEIFMLSTGKTFYIHRNEKTDVTSEDIGETLYKELLREIQYVKNNDNRVINYSLREDKLIEYTEKRAKELSGDEYNNIKEIDKDTKENNKEELRSVDDGLNKPFSLYFNKYKRFPLFNTSKIIYGFLELNEMKEVDITEAINRLSMFYKIRYTREDVLSGISYLELRAKRDNIKNNIEKTDINYDDNSIEEYLGVLFNESDNVLEQELADEKMEMQRMREEIELSLPF